MKYWVIDTETSVNGPKGFPASPFHPDNWMVACGAKSNWQLFPFSSQNYDVWHGHKKNVTLTLPQIWRSNGVVDVDLLVGHNIKFDLHYLRKGATDEEWRKTLTGLRIWDTQVVEYLLTGQKSQFASLGDLAEKYGVGKKETSVREAWASGAKTEEIDETELLKYLKNDVEITEGVFLKQLEVVKERNLWNLVLPQQEAVLAVADAEFNGIFVDKKTHDEWGTELLKGLAATHMGLQAALEYYVPPSELEADKSKGEIDRVIVFNPASPKQVADLLYDNTLQIKVRSTKVLKNKSVREKEEIVPYTVSATLLGPVLFPPLKDRSTAEDRLAYMLVSGWPYVGVINQLLKLRSLQKEYGTYYEGIAELIGNDGIVHPQLHQCSTATGRLSSSKPNAQNFPRAPASTFKAAFKSRFTDGLLVEFDFKQLEMICAAWLSEDAQLRKDILNGVDIHAVTAERVFGLGFQPEHRQACKTVNFGLLYGGKAGTLSKQAGISKSLAQNCIDAFYMRYPGIKKWQGHVRDLVQDAATHNGSRSAKGVPVKDSSWVSPTGRWYNFVEYDAPDWMKEARGVDVSFSPTEAANFPVQGLATGDIVPVMLGKLIRHLMSDPRLYENIKLVNTIHDSILLDANWNMIDKTSLLDIQALLETAPDVISNQFGIDFDLPLKVDAKYGKNWFDMQSLDKL